MLTVGELLDLCEVCDHNIVIYDENVIYDDADNYGDLLWEGIISDVVPARISALSVVSFDLESDVFRIWVDGTGVRTIYPEYM